jgi:subtilisin family serine protease
LYPAGYTEVIGVAATDFQDRLAGFSNFGKLVSLSAPGAFVISTFPGGNFALAWGTSYSAPMVSGAASLTASLKNRGASQGPAIVNTSDPIDAKNPGFEKLLGRGRLNVRRALER